MDVKGKTVVLTGDFKTWTRAEATAKLEALDAKMSGSVSSRTHVVFAGKAAGGKLDKARALGVQVLDEEALKAVIEGRDVAAPIKSAATTPASTAPAQSADATPASTPEGEDATREVLSLRTQLLALEAAHGVTDAHREASEKVLRAGASLWHGHAQPAALTAFALSPDGRHLAT